MDAGFLTDEIADFLNELTPDDTGRHEIGGRVLRYEGFTDLCIEDAIGRTKLPEGDSRRLADYDDVYGEVLAGWSAEEGREPLETGFSGTEENPTIWAIFQTPDPK